MVYFVDREAFLSSFWFLDSLVSIHLQYHIDMTTGWKTIYLSIYYYYYLYGHTIRILCVNNIVAETIATDYYFVLFTENSPSEMNKKTKKREEIVSGHIESVYWIKFNWIAINYAEKGLTMRHFVIKLYSMPFTQTLSYIDKTEHKFLSPHSLCFCISFFTLMAEFCCCYCKKNWNFQIFQTLQAENEEK